MTSKAILNLVNALTKPYIGAHLEFQGNDIKVWEIKEETFNNSNHEPGKVLDVIGNDIIVKTYDGSIRILDHEFNITPTKGEYL